MGGRMGFILLRPPPGWDAMELVERPQTPGGQCCQAAPGTALCPVRPSASRELAAAPQRLKVERVGGYCGARLLRCWAGVATLILHPISFLMALMQGMTGVGGELSPAITGPCPGMGRLLCSQSSLPGGRGSPFSPRSPRLLHAAGGSSSPARGCPAPLLAPTSPCFPQEQPHVPPQLPTGLLQTPRHIRGAQPSSETLPLRPVTLSGGGSSELAGAEGSGGSGSSERRSRCQIYG